MEQDRKRLIKAFWLAVGISLLLSMFQPYGRYLLYPFAFLSTWAHEMGHGLTAILVGGSFKKLVLFSNLGGTAYSTGTGGALRGPLVSAGGLLGPAVAGSLVVVLGSRSERVARGLLGVLAGALLLSLALWVRNLFGAVMVALVAAALIGLAWKGNEFVKLVVTQLIGIQLCLGSLSDFDYMFTKQFERDGKVLNSDTQNIAEHLLLPYWFWGALIAAISIALLALAFYVAWIRPLRKGKGKAAEEKAEEPQGAEAILDELGKE